jgi:hypothetical protein
MSPACRINTPPARANARSDEYNEALKILGVMKRDSHSGRGVARSALPKCRIRRSYAGRILTSSRPAPGDRRKNTRIPLPICKAKAGAQGTGTNIEITPAALQMAVAAGKFEARAVFVDHAGWFDNPSLRNLAGVTYGASWNEAEGAVEGVIRLYSEAAPVANLLDEVLGEGQAKPDRASMVFGRWRPSATTRDRRRIVECATWIIDLVFSRLQTAVLESCRHFSSSEYRRRTIRNVQTKRFIQMEMDGDKAIAKLFNLRLKPHASAGPHEVQNSRRKTARFLAMLAGCIRRCALRDWTAALSVAVANAMIGSSGLRS